MLNKSIRFVIIALCLLPIVACQYQQPQQQLEPFPEQHEYLDIETPEVFSFTPSPLQRPESLQDRPYFDFLSTLYAHDKGKKSLFEQQPRDRRQPHVPHYPAYRSQQAFLRQKRAVVFRPLFVYRQQEIRKQRLNDVKRH